VDPQANQAQVNGKAGAIHMAGSRLKAYVVPTDEELLIARDTVRCIEGAVDFGRLGAMQ
jgi:acetate kinase